MSEDTALIISIIIIIALLAIFFISYIYYRKTPTPSNCKNLKIDSEACKRCSVVNCEFKEMNKDIKKEGKKNE